MHGKEKAIGPVLEEALGVQVVVPKNFNTDRFGTFTREIARAGDMLQAATKKLNAALNVSGCDLGVASEGSFSEHPTIPLVQSNLELVLLIDRKNNLKIKGHYRNSETNINGKYVGSVEEAVNFAKSCGFPSHGVIVRKTENGKRFLYKNINTESDLKIAVEKILTLPPASEVFIEADMRAHKNPTRMKAIELAARDLVANIKSECRRCGAPGFVIINVEKGLPCLLCKLPTDVPMFEVFSCAKCGHKEKVKITRFGEYADAGQCGYCNP